MSDVVRVEGFYRCAPLIAFLRKGRDMAGITGDTLHTNHVLDGARAAQQEAGFTVVQLRVIPNVLKRRYDVLVESAADGENVRLRCFLETLDLALCRLNIEYEQKCKSGRLLAPHAYRMRDG